MAETTESTTTVSESYSISPSASEEAVPVPATVPIQKAIFYRNAYLLRRGIGVVGSNHTIRTKVIGPVERIPMWNNLGRPKNPRTSVIGYNLETFSIEYYTGKKWVKIIMKKLLP